MSTRSALSRLRMLVRRSKAAIYYRVLPAQRLQRSHLDLVPAGRLFRLTAELVRLKSRSCDRLLPRPAKLAAVCPNAMHDNCELARDAAVKAMLPNHSVYITDWSNARDVPLTEVSNSMIASNIS